MSGIGNAPARVKSSFSGLLPLVALAIVACGGAQSGAGSEVRERIEDLEAGREVSFRQMVADLSSARVIYVGEAHDDPSHHAAQLAILDALYEADPALALGVEMVQWPFQPALDAFIQGESDEATLLAEIEWEERWGFDFALYRTLFERCRERGIRIVALNARKEVTRATSRSGLDALPPELSRELPDLDLEVDAHRRMIGEALADHPRMTPELFERMYAAQVIWDETMAERVSEALAAPDGPARMLVIAGAFHVRHGVGIPDRASRRGAAPYRIVLPVSPGADPSPPGPRPSTLPGRYRWVLSGRPRTP